MLGHPVLDVHLGRLIAGERQIQSRESAVVHHRRQLVAIVELRRCVLLAEEKPVRTGVSQCSALVQESAERGNARPRADHDHRRFRVLRGFEMGRLLHEDGHVLAVRMICQVRRTHTAAGDAVHVVAHRGHRQLNFIGILFRARRDRIQPWLKWFQYAQPLVDACPNRCVGQHVDRLTAPHPVGQCASVLRHQQPLQVRVACTSSHERQQVRRRLRDFESFAQRCSQWHRIVARDVDDRVAVESRCRQPFFDECVTVSGPHAESVAGLVAQRPLGEVKAELTYVLGRARSTERCVTDQRGRQGRFLAVRRR